MAIKITNRNGKVVPLLNPSEKGSKFADELKNNIRYTNDCRYKADKNGNVLGLTPEQRVFRDGYLSAQKDSFKCYNYNRGKKKKKIEYELQQENR